MLLQKLTMGILPKPYLFSDNIRKHKDLLSRIDGEYKRNVVANENSIYERNKDKDSSGDQIFKKIVEIITGGENIQLYDYQLQFVKMCTVPLLPLIYGNQWKKNRSEILKKHGITKWYEEIFFVSSRRMGKTLTSAFFAIACALSIPSDGYRPLKIAVFANTLQASQAFIKETSLVLDDLKKKSDDFKIIINSLEIIIINNKNPRDRREIKCFCGRGDVS